MLKRIMIIAGLAGALCAETNLVIGGKATACADAVRTPGIDIIRVTLAADAIIPVGKYTIPFSSQKPLLLYPSLSVRSATLVKDTTLVIGVYTVTFAAGSEIYFHENGSVDEGYPSAARDVTLAVGPYRMLFAAAGAKEHYTLAFHANGIFKSGMLEKDATLTVGKEKVGFHAGRRISFYENGMPESGYCAKDMPIKTPAGTSIVKADTLITFHSNGMLRTGFLLKNTLMPVGKRSISFSAFDPKKQSYISFHTNGALESGFLSAETIFTVGADTFTLAPAMAVFHADGTPVWGTIAKRFAYEKTLNESTRVTMVLEPGERLYVYHPSGTINRCYGAGTNGLLKENIPFTVAGKELLLYRATRLEQVNDAAVLWNITPAEDILFGNDIIIKRGETMTYRMLEAILGKQKQ
ncbi:MAG: hypothetical protein HZC28_01355 [Spirochaetes bacterium]|nr:hypothetical protein [Spirochaetota bacterium]